MRKRGTLSRWTQQKLTRAKQAQLVSRVIRALYVIEITLFALETWQWFLHGLSCWWQFLAW